jgi:hypothetical protein
MLLSSKNLYLIILPAILFGSGAILLVFRNLEMKMDMLSVEPIISKYFKIRKSLSRDFIALLVPLIVFLLAGWFQTLILQAEVPQYPLLLTFARDYPTTVAFNYAFWIFYFPMFFLFWITDNRGLNTLAGQFIPILTEEYKKQKPLISLESVKQLLGLGPVSKMWIKEIIKKASVKADREGVLYFGVCGDYVYFKDVIVNILKEKLRERGEADINDVAKEIGTKPKLLKNIYLKLESAM